MATPLDLPPRTFRLGLAGVLVLAALLRGLFPVADPPVSPTVGIVWHDEGAWVHNARNKALFGGWSQDAWNPMYIAPVFTGLEYASFKAFGVGLWQARLVPEVLGWLSVWLLALGVARVAGRRAGLFAGLFLATNFVYVMWNRAALMEAPMTAFIVASWYCYTRSTGAPKGTHYVAWAFAAGLFAIAAFFTKAAAAFFVGALIADAALRFFFRRAERRTAIAVVASVAVCGAVALAVFVLPNWSDYRFYNWQMSVTRKPSYDLASLMNRVTWFPVLHDLFTRMWFVLVLGLVALLGLLVRWREAGAGERLLGWWVGLGALELLLHDVGNERRFVFFIPALCALAAIALARGAELVPRAVETVSRRRALLALPILAYAVYVGAAALIRIAFLYQIKPNVRAGAAVAVVVTALVYATWPRIPAWVARGTWSVRAAVLLALLVCAGQLVQYGQWAAGRTSENYEASVALGRVLAPGTLVHGKLANGLALENQIRPVFVGRGFGNYEDRKVRDDVRYILTYIAPSVGYESQAHNPVIQDVLDAYPSRRIIMTFDVAETTPHDRAALFDKFGGMRK